MSEVNRYFYVMWPEDREANSTSSHSPRASSSVAVAVENASESIVKVHGNGPISKSHVQYAALVLFLFLEQLLLCG